MIPAHGIHTHPTKKLGRRPIPSAKRALIPHLADHMDLASLPPPPSVVDWTPGITEWGLDGNDNVGDCAEVATLDNLQRALLASLGVLWKPDAAEVVHAYSAITGYDPARPETDAGSIETDVLAFARTTGVDGKTIDGFASIDPLNQLHVRQGAWIFGGLLLGLDLPIAAQGEDKTWTDFGRGPDAQPNSWGGHEVYAPIADDNGVVIVTWAKLIRLTWAGFRRYCSDVRIVTACDFLDPAGRAPNGWDSSQLEAAARAVGTVGA